MCSSPSLISSATAFALFSVYEQDQHRLPLYHIRGIACVPRAAGTSAPSFCSIPYLRTDMCFCSSGSGSFAHCSNSCQLFFQLHPGNAYAIHTLRSPSGNPAVQISVFSFLICCQKEPEANLPIPFRQAAIAAFFLTFGSSCSSRRTQHRKITAKQIGKCPLFFFIFHCTCAARSNLPGHRLHCRLLHNIL